MSLDENPGHKAHHGGGILLMVAGLSVAALTGALMKTLTTEMSPFLIAWFRFAGCFLVMLPFALARVGLKTFKPPRIGVQVIRGLLLAIGNILFMLGVANLNYADAISILYVYPFLMTLLAPAVLGERVGLIGWLGVFGGFFGVLVVIRPDFSGADAYALFVLCTGLMVALQMLLNRKLGFLSDPSVIAIWGVLIAALILTPTLPFFWTPISAGQLGVLALTAILSAVSQTMIILALARAPASELAPFTYSEIVAAVLIGLVMFGTLPDSLSWIGIGLIILSGLAVAHAKGRMTLRRNPKI